MSSGFFCCAPGGCILFCCCTAFRYGNLFQCYKNKEAEMGNTAGADVHADDIRLLQVHRKQPRPIRFFQYCAKRIIKKLLLTKNFMLQYVFLDIAYDILESTDWGITKVSVSLSNNERFDLMFTFVIRTLSYGRSLQRKAGKTFLHI